MLSASQVSAISRMYSSAVVKEMASRGKSPLFARLAREVVQEIESLESYRVDSFLDFALEILQRSEYRHEYVYKAAITNKILLGRHSLQTASMLHEFRVENCRADVAILNGTATVYEIKSERDSLTRLEKQIETFKKFFAKVYVIAGETHIDGIRSIVSSDVGILMLSDRNQIRSIVEAKDRPDRTCPVAIFESVRLKEAKQILKLMDAPVPDVSNTLMHNALKERFTNLNPTLTHNAMVKVLKQSRNLQPLSELLRNVPTSLQSAALTVPFRKLDHARLVEAIRTPLQNALAWG